MSEIAKHWIDGQWAGSSTVKESVNPATGVVLGRWADGAVMARWLYRCTRVAVAIGDVCGKGSEAAAITALARYTVRAAAMRHGGGPSQILGLLNEALLRQRAGGRHVQAGEHR